MVLQLIALPIIASSIGAENYGVFITVISAITVISFPLGNVLNNVRLLRDNKYNKENIKGDFNYILLNTSFLSTLLIITFSLMFFEELNILNLLLLIFIGTLSIFKDYLVVSYRIVLNFKGILINNVLLSFGYLIGTYLFIELGYWEIIYLSGLISCLIYILFSTDLLKEPFKKTKLFKSTLSDFSLLYVSSFLRNLLNYADKLILLPLLGPRNVAIYYAASILGKIISMLFNPINSVILSYIVKAERINNKVFLKAFFMIITVGLFGYFVTVFISPYFLNHFYPAWAEESLELIYITSATAVVAVMSSIFHPFNLRYNSFKWQIYMSGSNLLFYIIITLILTKNYGLIGFTFAVLLSGVFKFVFQMCVYFISQKYGEASNK